MSWFEILGIVAKTIMNIVNFFIGTDARIWAILVSAGVAFWGHTSSLRPYIHVYLSPGIYSKTDLMFNITNNGKVGAKEVSITLENGGIAIPRFHEETARGKSFSDDPNNAYDLHIPSFHKDEIVPPSFHYETLFGRGAGIAGNEKFTEPFVIIVEYKSCLPFIHRIPHVGQFKEKFYINPRIFNDLVGTSTKEVMDINLSFKNGKILGTAKRNHPS